MEVPEEGLPLADLGLSHDPRSGIPGGLLLQQLEIEAELTYAFTVVKDVNGNIRCLQSTKINDREFLYDREEVLGLISVLKERISAAMTSESLFALMESVDEPE